MKPSTLLSPILSLIDLFIPNLCVVCYQKKPLRKDIFCLKCRLELPFTDQHLIEENELELKLYGRIKFERGAALFRFKKESKVQDIIHQLKYMNRPHIGKHLGESFGEKLLQSANFDIPDMIIPIPLHQKKMHKRGYNQSTMFARGISEKLDIPILENCLIKHKSSDSQTEKSRMNRMENVLHSFSMKKRHKIEGKHILLVDDVLTTGATIEAAALKLSNKTNLKLSLGLIAMAEN